MTKNLHVCTIYFQPVVYNVISEGCDLYPRCSKNSPTSIHRWKFFVGLCPEPLHNTKGRDWRKRKGGRQGRKEKVGMGRECRDRIPPIIMPGYTNGVSVFYPWHFLRASFMMACSFSLHCFACATPKGFLLHRKNDTKHNVSPPKHID